MPQEIQPLALSITDFCDLIGISRRTFYHLADRDEAPPTIQIGRRRLIRREAAETWLLEREKLS
jgi:excisionase family DNA binding protein